MEEKKKIPAIGIAFRHLGCYGYMTGARYQATFASYALAVPRSLSALLYPRPIPKVQILRDVDGIVRPGEMLLVLGRPGSGCSTLLKTIAGDIRGFHIDEKTDISYQGTVPNPVERHRRVQAPISCDLAANAQIQESLMTKCSRI